MTRIAVTFALSVESSEFVRQLGNRSCADRNGLTIVHGKIGNRSIDVIHTGVGEKICRARIRKCLENQRFDFLISSGFAGSLNDELRVNDILIAKNFSTVDPKRAAASVPNIPINVINLLTMPAIIDSGRERERIASQSGASAIDMETESIARVCTANGIPLLSLRVITDTPSYPLPAPPTVLFDIQRQRTDIAVLAKFFLSHPNRFPGLIQFTRRIARARTILTNVLVEIVGNI